MNLLDFFKTYFVTPIISIANQCEFKEWDWAAFAVAAFALYIAIRTLNSQKATQKNTSPIKTMNIQKMLFVILIKQYYYHKMNAKI